MPITEEDYSHCTNPFCTRIGGRCVGWHCPRCGEPVSSQGHKTCGSSTERTLEMPTISDPDPVPFLTEDQITQLAEWAADTIILRLKNDSHALLDDNFPEMSHPRHGGESFRYNLEGVIEDVVSDYLGSS